MGVSWADCDSVLRTWVSDACTQLQVELGDNHVGSYLHGSLASGSFYPPKSDVDILFVVEQAMNVGERSRFATSAALINQQRPITGSLECSVVRRSILAQPVHPMPFEVHFSEDWATDILSGRTDFGLNRRDPDLAAHVQAMCEFGLALAGPPVSEVFVALDRHDFVDSLLGDLDAILGDENILDSPHYGVLNAARILWVLEGASARLVPSKEEACEWLIRSAPAQRREVIELALAVYRDRSAVPPEARRTGGREWPREALLGFRDWARERAESSSAGAS